MIEIKSYVQLAQVLAVLVMLIPISFSLGATTRELSAGPKDTFDATMLLIFLVALVVLVTSVVLSVVAGAVTG